MTKARITAEQKLKIYNMLDEGIGRHAISRELGLTPGQISALVAHRTMRAGRTSQTLSHTPKQIPQTQSPIPSTAAAPAVTFDIPLGLDSSEALVYWNPAKESNPHVLVVGESGSGKTYTVSRLAIELANRGLPSIIFDYGQGFTLTPEASQLAVNTLVKTLDLGAKGISINPLQIFPTDLLGPLTVSQRVADTFLRVYPRLGIQQHSLLRKAVTDVFRDSAILVEDKESWKRPAPAFRDLEAKITEYVEAGSTIERRAASALASHISTIFFFDTFRKSGLSLTWSDLLRAGNQLWVLKLNSLEESVEKAVTEFLLWNMIRFAESIGPGPLRCFIILDEAHRLAMADGSPVQRLLREGRKFGLGVILASQQPEDFTSVAYTNTATKLAFQLFDTNGRVVKQLRKRVLERQPEEILSQTVSSLPRGSAYLVSSAGGSVVRLLSFEEARGRHAANAKGKANE